MAMDVKVKIHRKNEASRLSFFLFTVLCVAAFLILSFLPKEQPPPQEKTAAPREEPAKKPPPLIENEEIIQRGETISDILSRHGFSSKNIHLLREEVKPVYDLAKIRAGQRLTIQFNPQGDFISLAYCIDTENYLFIQKTESTYSAEVKKIPYTISTEMTWGCIENNLINAIAQENEGAQLAILLEEIFAWDIDFYADLRQGDCFKIIYEKKYLDDEFISYGTILAAEFTNQGEIYHAYRYTYPDTQESDYFDFEGNSLRKEFLKSPISGARISSRFSHSRLHPIRKVWRPHYGVDYAAPVGTPVRSTAEGTVIFVGRDGANGRMIRIRHKNGYETYYLHLRRYAKGIKRGVKVQSSQIIGYVGASGEATGPHLDYRIKHRGNFINPLSHRFKPVEPLRLDFLEDFQMKAEQLQLSFNAPRIIFTSMASAIVP